jgi:two-component system chemotaxis response regulator CheY
MRPNILAVDDSKSVRNLVNGTLFPFDCDVSEATNGYNALFMMEKALPDLIILDINMPTMSGLTLLTMLKSKPELQAIPVIMLASPTDHPVMGEIKQLGVKGILMKPFTKAALLEMIRSVLVLNEK